MWLKLPDSSLGFYGRGINSAGAKRDITFIACYPDMSLHLAANQMQLGLRFVCNLFRT